jgi:hypothetical protein
MMRAIWISILFTAGLLLAGSDGEWFPWANFAGILLLAGILLFGRKQPCLSKRWNNASRFCK